MVHQIVKSKYSLFIESLILTFLILFVGFGFGFIFESMRTDSVIKEYREFEISSFDLRLQNYYYQIMDRSTCDSAIEQNFIFADDVYNEGLLLQKYEEASELSESILREKKRYVLLKTELWLNTILLKEKCNDPFNTIVYVYAQYGNNAKKAEQDAVSDVLRRLKEKRGNDVVLIPLAGDLDLNIVGMQLSTYNVSYFPSIIIDEKYVLEGFHSVEDIEKYID